MNIKVMKGRTDLSLGTDNHGELLSAELKEQICLCFWEHLPWHIIICYWRMVTGRWHVSSWEWKPFFLWLLCIQNTSQNRCNYKFCNCEESMILWTWFCFENATEHIECFTSWFSSTLPRWSYLKKKQKKQQHTTLLNQPSTKSTQQSKNTYFISNCCNRATKNKLQRNTRPPRVQLTSIENILI